MLSTSNLFYDTTNNRLGINTNTPGETIHLNDTLDDTSAVRLTNTGNTTGHLI